MAASLKLRRLPASIRLPYGFTIRVLLVTDGEMLEAMDEDKRAKEEMADGLWDVDQRVIYVRSKLPLMEQWDKLGHELDHAVNDWRHWLRITGKAA